MHTQYFALINLYLKSSFSLLLILLDQYDSYGVQIDGMPVLSPEYIYRSCNCCYYNGSLYRDGERNITMEDGRNASCCNGELVMPIAQ